MVTARHPTTVNEVYQAPYGKRLRAGEHLTCLYEMEHTLYLINKAHCREDANATTDRIEFVGTEAALALEYQERGCVHLYLSLTLPWHAAGDAWRETPLMDQEAIIPGVAVPDQYQLGDDIWM